MRHTAQVPVLDTHLVVVGPMRHEATIEPGGVRPPSVAAAGNRLSSSEVYSWVGRQGRAGQGRAQHSVGRLVHNTVRQA